MGPAPAFNCVHCQRRIGKTAEHWVHPRDQVYCVRCHLDSGEKAICSGTRAGIARRLELWPRPAGSWQLGMTGLMSDIRRGDWDPILDYLKFPYKASKNGFAQFELSPIPTYLAEELERRVVHLLRGGD